MLDRRLLEILACPWCLGGLDYAGDRLICRRCGARYPVVDDIPHMLVSEAELRCAACGTVLEKRGDDAVCKACGRRYRMTERIEGDLLDHARRFCPRCDPEDVELVADGEGMKCPRCGARFER